MLTIIEDEPKLVLGAEKWQAAPFRFLDNLQVFNDIPSWQDVILRGNTVLTLVNAKANGLKTIKLFGKCEQTPNLFDKDKATLNYYINSSGEEQYNASWACSDYIEVTAGKTYNLSGVTSYGNAPKTGFYAADKSFVSSRSQSSADFTIPDGVKYMRVSIYKANIDTAVVNQVLSMDNPIPILCNNGEVGSTGYTVVGSPTISSDLVLSNTSGVNYVYFANINLGSNFEIITKFTTGDNVTSENFILGTVGRYFVVKYQNAKISFGIGDGSSWKTGNTDSTTSLAIDTTYYYKLTFDGSTYNAYLSIDGINWNLEKTVALTTIVPMFSMRVGCHGNSGSNAAIDLKGLLITIDNNIIRLPETISLNGQTATAQDLLSCGDDYTDVQNVTTGEITHKVGVHIFDGTENWSKSANQPSSGIRFQANTGLTNRAYGANLLGLCTHFNTVASSAIQQNINTFVYSISDEYIFVIVDSNVFPTVEDWTSYVASLYAQGKPIIITYPLATPTTETVTAQANLQTIAGNNTLTITQSAIDGLSMEVTYSAGVEVTIEEVQNVNIDQTVEVIIGE